MRALIGFVALSLVACSSAPTPDPMPNPNPVKPVEPTPTPVYTAPEYPQAEGKNPGQIIPDMTWDAFLPTAAAGVTGSMSMHDFFDPDGTRGVNAILVITSAEWCGACMSEAMTLESKIRSKWGAEGVMIIELMIENTTKQRDIPSVTGAADRWRTKFNFSSIPVGIDPAFTYAHTGTNGLPLNVVIDPRDMRMVFRQDGAGGMVESQISTLVAKNKIQ